MGTILKMRTFLPLFAVLACAYGIAVPRKPCSSGRLQEADHLQSLSGLQQENINLTKADGDGEAPRDCGWNCWYNDYHNRDMRARAADCWDCRYDYGFLFGTCYCCGCAC